ncbi:rhomboid family intramembrane serine protease GlpG [Flocculibacter collagenilyticus]|uniref:rhomboid family intramembrane serine protease GlpG n=1 Tax=Flocculibacter collagenilyticus TaxID=2744479 RepID=UPI0018F45EE0|nr:rhomboid family intramembrane serine protease GlpG [Flocculibacter collagenilyticus]
MQLLTEMNNARLAQAFIDYLAVNNIAATLQEVPNGSAQTLAIYVEPDKFSQANHELSDFIANPNDEKYWQASWDRNSAESPLVYTSSQGSLFKSFITQGGIITQSVLWSCVVIYLLLVATQSMELLNYFRFFDSLNFIGQSNTYRYAREATEWYELWRWFSPAFIHFTLMHLVFNLIWWWQLGGQVETKLSKGHLIILFFITAILSNTAQFVMTGNNFGGLSGVVYGLVGFTWLLGLLRPNWGIVLPNAMMGFMFIWMILGFADMLWVNMANYAHLVGLLSGLGYAAVLHKLGK